MHNLTICLYQRDFPYIYNQLTIDLCKLWIRIFLESSCHRGEQTDAIGWLKLGADGHWWNRGGMVRRITHTEYTSTHAIDVGVDGESLLMYP